MNEPLQLHYKPKLPRNKRRGIGIIGAGEIVQEAHLPAYRMAGFHVVGITNRSLQRAEEVANLFSIPRVYTSIEELLADPDIEIVDIALPAELQPEAVRLATLAGKHVLCQKPLGATFKDAKRIVELCASANVIGAINQQMRWAPGIRASHDIISRGWLGELTQASIQVNVETKFEQWPFLRTIDTLEVMYHSIHYLDSIRFLFGDPLMVYADGAQFPGQVCKGETRTLIHLIFPGEARGLVHDNHNSISTTDDWYATYRFEGTRGVIKGTNGALYSYPQGREDTLSFTSKELAPDCWIMPKLEGKWFPHAFMGTMGELMCAIEEGRQPENSVADNLQTMRLVFAAYRSMRECRAVRLTEVNEEG
ncbi:Gfo/Idh/MocA family protein [Paenibacillus sp. YYML68]|uniref:Gfo/Idh/MocA family protein n=1 Tax=Paenibacillus sp. YYML68 TaxID=2909250 RepID=UPI00248FAE7A|nr:Gfo/Idh/MocA family oxidoreductase [Paenibacillus sp. YYML68]